jgi:phage shock protein PspC (stress-responsive transcriptional regulator)
MAWSVEPGIMGAMQTEQRVLTRRKDGRLIAGVAGGLADYTATPVTWWRWGFALVALLGCLGFLVLAPVVIGDGDSFARFGCLVVLLAGGIAEWIYIAMWILVPRVDLPRPASFSERLETRPGRVGLALAITAAGLVGMWLGLWGGAVALASLLIGVGVGIFRRGGEEERAQEEVSWNAGPEAIATPSPETTAVLPLQAVVKDRPPRVRKERSKLGWLSLGLAFVVGGLIWLLDASETTHLSASQTIAAPVVVLAIGLLVGSVFGHAKWTFLFAVLLVPAMVVTSAIGMPLTGTYAHRIVHPTSGSELQPSYVLTGGELDFDLTDLPPGAHPAPIHAALGIGQIRVTTSPCVPVDIKAGVNAGNISLVGGPGHSRGGFSATGVVRTKGADPIVMDLRAGIGEIDIERGFLTKREREACGR